MHRSSSTEHGLLIAAAALACLAVTPVARGQDTVSPASDPAAAAVALAEAALAGGPLDAAAVAAAIAPALSDAAQPLPNAPTPVAAPEAVPAAAAEPNPAMEPHPSPPPPPPQPEALEPLELAAELAPISVEEIGPVAPSTAVAAVEAPQYQPAPPQYQPPAAVTPASAPPETSSQPATPEQEWSWDWTWSCGGSKQPTQPPAIPGEGIPENWSWNWNWNCGPGATPAKNRKAESGGQYQGFNSRYQPVNVNISIRIGSPGDDGAVAQTNVVLAVEAGPAAATVEASAPAPQPPSGAAAAAPRTAPAQVEKPKQSGNKPASPTGETRGLQSAQPAAAEAPLWTARPVVSGRLQPNHPEANRSRPQLRRPTRRPLPPRRAPAIPVGSSGPGPPVMGSAGSDGGGFGFALLLVPFVLALVDSVRRSVRDITPPVGRAFRARQERPG